MGDVYMFKSNLMRLLLIGLLMAPGFVAAKEPPADPLPVWPFATPIPVSIRLLMQQTHPYATRVPIVPRTGTIRYVERATTINMSDGVTVSRDSPYMRELARSPYTTRIVTHEQK